jgi:hypothetical protein
MVEKEFEGDGWLGSGEGGSLTMQRLRERDAFLSGLAANNLAKKNILGKLNFQNKRSASEKYVILWAMIMSFYHIYFCGTFVIFSSVIGRKGFGEGLGKGSWIFSAWQSLGRADKRYIQNDVYLICLNGVLALVVSPLLLFFAWSTFVRAPYRHLSGIIASSMMIYTAILYFGVEMMPWSHNFNFDSDPGQRLSLLHIIFLDLCFLIMPSLRRVYVYLVRIQKSHFQTHYLVVILLN